MSKTRTPEIYANEINEFLGRLPEYLNYLKSRYQDLDQETVEAEARDFFTGLMNVDIDKKGRAMLMDRLNYLVLQSEIYLRRYQNSTDPAERDLNFELFNRFANALYGDRSLEQGLYEYCWKNAQQLGPVYGKRWGQLTEAMAEIRLERLKRK